MTVSVEVLSDLVPTAKNDTITIDEDAPATLIDVLANDMDDSYSKSELTIIAVGTLAEGGIASIENNQLSYLPAENFFGTVTFTYTIQNPAGGKDTATVIVYVTPVNDAPVVKNISIVIQGETPAEGNLLTGSTDAEGDALSVTILTQPANGTLTVNQDGSYTYLPNAGFDGEDTFEYEVCDDNTPSACVQATATIAVNNEQGLVVSEGFSPNGDGNNDTWYIKGIEAYPNNEVKVINRWGNVVFQAKGYDNITKVWNGSTNEGLRLSGSELPYGTYFYIVDIADGKSLFKGHVVVSK